ncbi:MAG: hypothetical protein PHE84_02950 [bacterium]|nr:hypothetical protein [bacterium]
MKIKTWSILVSIIALLFFVAGVCQAKNKHENESSENAKTIGVGELVKSLDFEDIDGKKGSTDDYKDWIIIYSFADRKNNKDLIGWISDAGIGVAKAHPEAKIVYINFADVTIVPYSLRHLVTPILRLINRRSTEQMQETYASKGVSINSEKLRFVMVPDWTGKYLEAFRLPNAKEYHTYVALEGKILAIFDAQTQNIKDAYISFFDKLIASLQSVRDSIEPLPGSNKMAPVESAKEPASLPTK